MMRPGAGLALSALLLGACGPASEREPNDDFTQASAVGRRGAQGTLAGARDRDLYRLEVRQESASLSIRLGGIREADFVLSVFDRDRRELKRADETASGGDEELLDIGVARGTYYVAVSNKNEKADNPSQAYALDLRLDKGLGREREPDDSPQTASPLDVPGVNRGHYWPSRNLLAEEAEDLEQDWYRVEVATGLYLLNLDLSGVSQVDAVLEVYDANGYKLKEVDSGGVGEGESLRSFGVRGPVSYALRLYSKFRTGQAGVPYEMLSELIPYQGRGEFEPNDQRADATPLREEAVTGTIAPQGDSDWYGLEVPDDGRHILRAAVTGVEGMDLVLRLCDSFGAPIVEADNMGRGQPEVLTGAGVVRGAYYLEVFERSGRKADSRASYTLTQSLSPSQPELEYELNDSTASAQPLRVGSAVDGYIAPKGDADFYQFNVYQAGTVAAELAGVRNVRFEARLFDQDYRELGVWSAPKPGEPLSFEKPLEAGTYFLGLAAAEPAQNNVRDKYSLRLKIR